ncbi:uncharacterized protein Z518_03492 [Rhinocladiella mackenziei CBS 650.93]|uniref:Major facilitator superfamily (MFS) profile domain-containing protein n=1 Tax=Rhinocladiella mackenziei CBS 650.93 TaxID=1442369 RepID=A0A0D2JHK7_9EURO|nr:uncharacterized protein Z518_03492 [Rhinocladiella mackenziei CBS 650.93]KIX08835.1 hypothetical protein Z518_03492 [Rhinocladiella mackenziei CBS 650.93]
MALEGRKLYRDALVAGSLGFITFGWDAGVLGGVLQTPEFQAAIGNPTDTYQISMVTSTFLLASWLGCMVITFLGSRLGRKTWILVGNFVEMIGTIICASSYSYGQMISGRVFIGIGNGFLTSMIPVYVAEMATQKELRGRGVNGMIAAASLGTALAYWVDFGMVFLKDNSVIWRFPVALQALFAILTIVAFGKLPETPRYFYMKGQDTKADAILEQVYGAPLDQPQVQHARAEILAALELERAEQAALKITDFFRDTSSMQSARRIRTGVILVGIAYLMGINVIFYYTTTIFQIYIGLEPLTASGLAGASTTLLAITNYMGVYWLEKFGRRTWLLAGASLQTVFMAIFTGLLSSPGPKTGAAAAAMLFAWIAVFGPTWGPVTYVYASEINPLRYRHIGFALSVCAQWLMSFVTVFAGPIAIADPNVGWKTWIWFLVFNFIAIPFVYFSCPETRGYTMEEIDLIFMLDKVKDTSAAKTLQREGAEESASSAASINEQRISAEKSAA